jgi:dCTP deaminase
LLLSDAEIRMAVLAGDISFGGSFDYRQIQSSSVDLTASRMYVPDSIKKINKVPNISSLAVGQCMIEAGETIVIELAEDIKIGKEFGGILMPPNSLTKNGIIMTNPGHIDPGYSGKLTVCLINMGKDATPLEPKSVVATLLLFNLSSTSAGYQRGPGKGANLTQLSKLSKDFANISERSYSSIRKAIWLHLATALVIASLGIAVLALVVPGLQAAFSGQLEAKYNESRNGEAIKKLENQLEALQNQLAKRAASSPINAPATLGTVAK